MTTYKDLQADLHIHTVSSGHAFSTIGEIVAEAQKKGLKSIAITDHGPALPGGAHPYHFSNLRVLKKIQNDVQILTGVEANIIDADGTLDLPEDLLGQLDLVLATFHARCGYEDLGSDLNTKTLIKTLKKYKVHIIAHPGNPLYKLDYEEVAKAAKDIGVLIEFNNSSYTQTTSRSGADDLDYQLALACKRYGTGVVLTSDAHIACDVGSFEKAWDLVSKAGLDEKQILNLDNKRLLNYLSGQAE